MAIIKQAKNISIEVIQKYELRVGVKLEKIAQIMNVEATAQNLSLASNKKIVSSGNKT
ncbi:hypothetical protein EV200_103134 [Pedobacter psychrotolerans]|uniref:Uncharacterized protein n=1 Tax=Pedobacter psychrotolerans TaxID=1843235 RepID=A0A4R2HIM4_9SPHI|nr:hypothetical protein [Pedobacter psychrotolerans]TCO26803.1 hypothetical protein EV200_103134 [Pedobacter psychrotolerans]GGE56643.1 hypothetical protein GCM10011413_23760 [Pedobacter psychrotolerans]